METPENREQRLDDEVEEAREEMLVGEDTPWSEREPHRGEAAYTTGGEYLDPAESGEGGLSGGANFAGGSVSANSGGTSTGSGGHGRGDDTPGAFGEEEPEEPGTDIQSGTGKNAIDKLQDT